MRKNRLENRTACFLFTRYSHVTFNDFFCTGQSAGSVRTNRIVRVRNSVFVNVRMCRPYVSGHTFRNANDFFNDQTLACSKCATHHTENDYGKRVENMKHES